MNPFLPHPEPNDGYLGHPTKDWTKSEGCAHDSTAPLSLFVTVYLLAVTPARSRHVACPHPATRNTRRDNRRSSHHQLQKGWSTSLWSTIRITLLTTLISSSKTAISSFASNPPVTPRDKIAQHTCFLGHILPRYDKQSPTFSRFSNRTSHDMHVPMHILNVGEGTGSRQDFGSRSTLRRNRDRSLDVTKGLHLGLQLDIASAVKRLRTRSRWKRRWSIPPSLATKMKWEFRYRSCQEGWLEYWCWFVGSPSDEDVSRVLSNSVE